MDWLKAVIHTTSEGVEPVIGTLLSCGINGVQIFDPKEMRRFLNEDSLQWDYVDENLLNGTDTDARIEFYVSTDTAGREILSQVQTQLNVLAQSDIGVPLGSLLLSSEMKDDESWLHEWKKFYKPFKIGRSVMVVPVWEKYAPKSGETIFTIDPGSVFGTGLHQTTQLSIEELENFVQTGDSVMDIGCGSGILSVISLLLGANNSLACDFDPAAAIAAKENGRLNHIGNDKLKIFTGDIFKDEGIYKTALEHPFDIVVANIVADVIIKLTPMVKNFLKPRGVFISSGIISEREDDVVKVLSENYYKIENKKLRDGWLCLVARNA